MTTTKHLQLIKSECERLLAIAEKRTQGEWETHQDDDQYFSQYIRCPSALNEDVACAYTVMALEITRSNANAAYIAACAGRAEAGWRSTIMHVDHLRDLIEAREEPFYGAAIYEANRLITAWPIELLTQ